MTRVVNGRIEVDAGALAEGHRVKVVILDEDPITLTAEERNLLRESIASGDVDDGLDAVDALDAGRMD
jgi:hypothetical protein